MAAAPEQAQETEDKGEDDFNKIFEADNSENEADENEEG